METDLFHGQPPPARLGHPQTVPRVNQKGLGMENGQAAVMSLGKRRQVLGRGRGEGWSGPEGWVCKHLASSL
jgi:hypothetical protein